MTALVEMLGVDGLIKKEKRLMHMDNGVVTVGRGWWMEVKEVIREINGYRKNTI